MRRATIVLPVPGGPYSKMCRKGAERLCARAMLSASPPTVSRSSGAKMIPSNTRSDTLTDGSRPVASCLTLAASAVSV
eukprot:CAMPEP_0171784658 /NCGR_PEP_ID=MMETSP0991-20121206/62214_1 /TAXON_ID=483369 /ORGANISM="non described non described, Strain CCMP2098" /LENGTH=77 /DNA_ID=CAMNT_0012393017 /DNA_START=27 /DNA_END=256 /DNA_ORIENTATION=-